MTSLATPAAVLDYWFKTLSPKDWYVANDAVDTTIIDRFQPTWEAARDGKCDGWNDAPGGTLAFLILTDQFPRNMFRGDGRSFATDGIAMQAAGAAIDKDWDLEIPEPDRQFFYLPFMHAEDIAAQLTGIGYFQDRMPDRGGDNLAHAKAHHWVIEKFGRFPYRNAALNRQTTAEEQAFLDAGGYRHALEQVRSDT